MVDWLKTCRGWRRDLIAAVLGALAAAALPPVHAVPVLLLVVPGLLALLAPVRGWHTALRIGFWFGFGHHLFGLYWITEAVLIEADRFWWLVPFAVPAIAAVVALFIGAACAITVRFAPGLPRVLALAGAWGVTDLVRQFALTGFPWNPWGSVWSIPGDVGALMSQPAALVGVHGLTIATLLIAASVSLGRRGMAAGTAGLVVWIGLGAWLMGREAGPAPGISVLIVQGNVPQGQKWDVALANIAVRRYLDLTRAGIDRASGVGTVVLWPETAFYPFLLEREPAARAAIYAAAAGPALIGGMRVNPSGQPLNSMMVVDGPGPITQAYDKWHLVPFGEYSPFWMPLPIMLGMGSGFAAGAGPATLHVPGLPPVGLLICYEAIFTGQVVDRADRPDWLANGTNDAWFGNSSGPRQHLAAARLRAIEEGLPLFRAANTGISAAYDGHGRMLGSLPMNVADSLLVPLPGPLPPGWFARIGLPIPAALAALCLALAALMQRRRI
jgi:apolipoprotein N-acyltransferase